MPISQEEIQKYRSKYNLDSGRFQTGAKQPSARMQRLKQYTTQDQPQAQQAQQKPRKGFFKKIEDFGEATFGKAADFLFGTTGKVVGTMALSGVESAAKLMGKDIETGVTTFGEQIKGEKIAKEEKIGPVDIAFTALELAPGGSLTKALKKMPGGEKIAKNIVNTVKNLGKKEQAAAIKLYSEALAPTTKAMKRKTQKIVPELMERQVKGSIPKIQEKAAKKVAEFGTKIDEVVEAIPKTAKIETKPLIEKMYKSMDNYRVGGKVIEPRAIKAMEDVVDVIKQFGDEVDVKNIREIRKVFDKQVAKRGGFEKFSDEITAFNLEAKKKAANIIRDELTKEVPDLAKVNKEFSFWKNVLDVTSATAERTAAQSGRLRERIAQATTGLMGMIFGGPAGAVIGSAVGKKASQVINSSAFKTMSSIKKDKFAKYLLEGDMRKALNILTKSAVITKNIADKISNAIYKEKEEAEREQEQRTRIR